jgi:uncharacterized membrane protein
VPSREHAGRLHIRALVRTLNLFGKLISTSYSHFSYKLLYCFLFHLLLRIAFGKTFVSGQEIPVHLQGYFEIVNSIVPAMGVIVWLGKRRPHTG